MQAIEFDSVVQNQVIPLPPSGLMLSGKSVRVVVMFNHEDEPTNTAADDAISQLAANPIILPDFFPLSRDGANER